jgi:hypothetical protein
MASQFITFLDKFFTLFPEYEHDDVGSYEEFQMNLTNSL